MSLQLRTPMAALDLRPAIEVVGLDCGYGGDPILKNVNFTVAPGEVVFICGGSGCGKSTLLRHMVGLITPSAGEVRYFGESFYQADAAARLAFLRRFGILYQGGALWSSLTLLENVALPLEEFTPLGRQDRLDLAAFKLSQVGLAGYEGYYPAEISGGMKKRAGLARALALDPDIVFFDEPSAGLDPLSSRQLDELILSLRALLGMTCVIVSHELDSILGIGDRLVMLDRAAKGVIATGRPRALAAGEDGADARVREFLTRGRDRAAAKSETNLIPS
jgi:phospholipid/cholesterol/gamma-HCH transport system ATP-binding protein